MLSILSIFTSDGLSCRVISRSYQTAHLPDDALARQNRLGQAGGHFFVAVDHWKQETEVLLGAAQVVAQRRAPAMAIGLQGVLEVTFFQSLFDRVGGMDRGPAVRINVFAASG